MTTFYLIRNKRTKKWISALDDNGAIRSKGFTHAHLSDTETPRLFHNMNSARNALTVWLKGKLVAKRTPFRGVDSFYDEGEDVEMICTPQEDRKRNEMEIVPCKIIVLETKEIKGALNVTTSSIRVP